MTQYWDLFGSDEFHENVSNPASTLASYRDHIDSNPKPQYEYELGVNVTVTDFDQTIVSVDKCWDGDSSSDDTCFGAPHISIRRSDAEGWLQNNFGLYSSSSICIVFDYYDGTSKAANTGGKAIIDGVNTYGEKTVLVNVAATENISLFSAEWVAGHELGHTVGCEHEDVKYHYCGTSNKLGSYMHTGDNVSSTCSCDDDNVGSVYDNYSSCARSNMHT